MQQLELAQMQQREANLTALAAIGPRKKRPLDSSSAGSGLEVQTWLAMTCMVVTSSDWITFVFPCRKKWEFSHMKSFVALCKKASLCVRCLNGLLLVNLMGVCNCVLKGRLCIRALCVKDWMKWWLTEIPICSGGKPSSGGLPQQVVVKASYMNSQCLFRWLLKLLLLWHLTVDIYPCAMHRHSFQIFCEFTLARFSQKSSK